MKGICIYIKTHSAGHIHLPIYRFCRQVTLLWLQFNSVAGHGKSAMDFCFGRMGDGSDLMHSAIAYPDGCMQERRICPPFWCYNTEHHSLPSISSREPTPDWTPHSKCTLQTDLFPSVHPASCLQFFVVCEIPIRFGLPVHWCRSNVRLEIVVDSTNIVPHRSFVEKGMAVSALFTIFLGQSTLQWSRNANCINGQTSSNPSLLFCDHVTLTNCQNAQIQRQSRCTWRARLSGNYALLCCRLCNGFLYSPRRDTTQTRMFY
jgi:hypothetical protein